jgi:hypothetical protein
MQEVDAVAAIVALNFPAPQIVQSEIASWLVAVVVESARYVPAGHGSHDDEPNVEI